MSVSRSTCDNVVAIEAALCLVVCCTRSFALDAGPQTVAGNGPADEPAPVPRVLLLENEEAWKRLPVAAPDAPQPLPVWARAFAGVLPHTTAVMLEQDYLYRTSRAFDPGLRAKMRWVAADANRCAYGKAYADADLQRAGMSADEIARWVRNPAERPAAEQAALAFARKMTLAASTLTDDEVQQLIDQFGEQPFCAMVLQMAFANFQDRLLLTLNVPVEPGGPLPPLDIEFAPPKPGEAIPAAPRSTPATARVGSEVPLMVLDRDWTSQTFENLQQQMEQQRARPGRVSIPEWPEVQPKLPPGMYPADRPMRVKWSLAVLGHQPELGSAWLKGLRTFSREANHDRVFQESLFWVVTRSLQCFY
jgi:alkylhydroperoxidase family enzyme